MKSKYHLALKFFNETKNNEQLELCYKEIEGFLDQYDQFRFYIELNINKLDEKLEAQLSHEERELMQNEDFLYILNDYRFRNCENVFSNYNYNFELFKYSLEKIFEEERKVKKEKEDKEKLLNPSKGYSFGFWMSIAFLVGIMILLGANYNRLIV